ncbi:MAG: hypothetical protein ACI9N1_000343 [Flavobacteriales bacterium]|jgi:hypothetical protein
MSKKKINVQGAVISILENSDSDYISLTDISKGASDRRPAELVSDWLRNDSTISFLGAWEKLHNPNFKVGHLPHFRTEKADNRKSITPQKWIEEFEAIGLISKSGRYGGTFAHSDIAINFCYWLAPEFQVYLIKEYQALKVAEFNRLSNTIPREITKANYGIVTGIVDTYLVGTKTGKAKGLVFASEGDLINKAVFGMTAKEWRRMNPTKKGNMRDHATTVELQAVSNIEMLHAYLVANKVPKNKRLSVLEGWAAYLLVELPKYQATKRIAKAAKEQKKLK